MPCRRDVVIQFGELTKPLRRAFHNAREAQYLIHHFWNEPLRERITAHYTEAESMRQNINRPLTPPCSLLWRFGEKLFCRKVLQVRRRLLAELLKTATRLAYQFHDAQTMRCD